MWLNLLCDPTIPLLGKRGDTVCALKHWHTDVHPALFMTAKHGKNPMQVN